MKFFTSSDDLLHRILDGCAFLVGILLLLVSCTPASPFDSSQRLPLDMQSVVPADWVPLGGLKTVNIDGDGDNEWLLFYRYDVQKVKAKQGPVGGVIFDAQFDPTSGASTLVPYKLLPDFRAGKGQGFLAEQGTPGYRTYDSDGDGAADELAIFGYGNDPTFPMYLTVFRWQGGGTGKGYRVVTHLFGDGGISVKQPEVGKSGPISTIIQKTRLNERSLLSKRAVYVRQADGYNLAEVSLDFTYGIPPNPYYPEATVLAYYLLRNGGQADDASRLLVPEVNRQPLQASLVTSAPALPSSAFSVPSSTDADEAALPLSLSYTGDAVVTGEAALGGSNSSLGTLSYVDVSIDVAEGDQQVTRVWRVVNMPGAGCESEVCWRLLGRH
jgi:hypothetical protein